VIVAPALGIEYTGVVGGSATRGGEPCAVSSVAELESAMLATGFPYDRAVSRANNFDAFVAIKRKTQAVRRCGSAALDLCLVADGTYDGYWEQKVKPWDVAGGSAVVLAAGGRITDYEGRPAPVTHGAIVATNGRVHDAIVHELSLLP
jgi:myo-inositol-1(or 4)-monophosphatase